MPADCYMPPHLAAGLGICAAAWRAGANDATPAGWTIVAGYVAAAACCLRAWRREIRARAEAGADQGGRFVPRLWLALSVILVMFAFNKQLDLHALMTEQGRRLAREGGWYEKRRQVQLIFAAAVGAGVSAGLMLLAWRLRRALRRCGLALAGFVLLAGFVIMRMTSFQHVDEWFGRHGGGVPVHRLAEPAAIAVIIAGALLPFRQPKSGEREAAR